jgi:hypothetical protein
MNKTFIKLTSFALALAMMLTLVPSLAFAANVSAASDNMTRQKISETSDHIITFTPVTSGEGPVVVTFPALFDVSSVTGENVPGQVVSVAGQVVSVTGALVAATPYSFTLANIVNPGTAANYVIDIATGLDTGKITVPILADDQIQVTALVDQTLFFNVRDGIDGTFDDNEVQFGTLTSGAARYATDSGSGGTTAGLNASELEAGTNAPGGYIIDVTGETLTSTDGTNITIDPLETGATSIPGMEQFGINVTRTQVSTGGTAGIVNSDYGTTDTYHLPTATTTETLVTNAGPASIEIYEVDYLANISALTPAGNYSAVLTFTMTASF